MSGTLYCGDNLEVLTEYVPPGSNSQAAERLGYPTQKPLPLLQRIIAASSNPGDLVLDPFCGCGTTIEACERLGRRWIGIDIARKAVEVIEGRFSRLGWETPEVIWHPKDMQAAEALAGRDKMQFEKWALRKVRAARTRKKDRGIDGEAFFRNSEGKTWHALISVKGGSMNPAMVRDLRGTLERERADVALLVSMREPSKEMKLEATRAGHLSVSDSDGPIPRLQLVTIEQIFGGRTAIRSPGVNVTEMPKPSVPQGSGGAAHVRARYADGVEASARQRQGQTEGHPRPAAAATCGLCGIAGRQEAVSAPPRLITIRASRELAVQNRALRGGRVAAVGDEHAAHLPPTCSRVLRSLSPEKRATEKALCQ